MKQSVLFGLTLLLLCCDESRAWGWWGGSSDPPPATPSPLKNVTTLNGMVDVHLRELRPILIKYGMDPFKAPNVSQSLGIGTLDLTSIVVCNISTLQRTGDVAILDNKEAHLVTINVALGVVDLQIFADYYAGNWLMSSGGNLKGTLPEIKISVAISLDLETVQLSLKSFTLTKNDETMQLQFYGSYISYIINLFSSVIIYTFGNLIVQYVEGPVRDQIVQLLDRVNLEIKASMANMG